MIRLISGIDVINFFASIKTHKLKLLHLRFLLETGGKSDEAGNRGGRNLEAGNPENVKSQDMNRLAVHCTVCKLTLSGLKVSNVRTSLPSSKMFKKAICSRCGLDFRNRILGNCYILPFHSQANEIIFHRFIKYTDHMTKIDEGIYKWDKRTTHKFVGGLWASFESQGGGFDALHMFGGREPPRGQEKFNGSQRELLMAVSRGQNGSAQKTGEKRKISRGLELASQISRWFCGTFRWVRLN